MDKKPLRLWLPGNPPPDETKPNMGWINVAEKMPEEGQPIWIRFSQKNGKRYSRDNHVMAAEVGRIYSEMLCFSVPPNIAYEPGRGPRHWQPRLDAQQPEWEMPAEEPKINTLSAKPLKSGSKFTPEELHRRSERMKALNATHKGQKRPYKISPDKLAIRNQRVSEAKRWKGLETNPPTEVKATRRKYNMSPEGSEAHRQVMLAYWEKRRNEQGAVQ